MKVSNGKTVLINYTLKLENGAVYETTEEDGPLAYSHGKGEIVSGLEKALEGLEPGDSTTFMLHPEEAYGEVKLESLVEVPKEHVPMEAREVGSSVTASGPNLQQVEGTVYEVKKDTLVIDFNHPLAGMDLYFDVTVMDVQDEEEQEEEGQE